ncbi:MAG: RdgB/HAM1 family non-canonical purine NTP pyrophosphatase [Bacteroidetes bacterium]|nr:RdgB/HAM1 family non-canonical purine NTP pyrophosphatase [Bacteroidota bacterium]
MELVFASNNKHKLSEISEILNPGNFKNYKIKSLHDIGFYDEIEENGTTLEQNALIKAMTVYKASGQNCFADDSGLFVNALNGRPGVYSARYAGKNCTFAQNNEKLLGELKNEPNRKAFFKTIVALVLNGEIHYFEGKIEGNISTLPSGTTGFGYDPVFIPDGFNISFAQMTSEQKNSISHRRRALNKMTEFLNQNKV